MEYRTKEDWTTWCIPAGAFSGVRIGIHWSFPLIFVFHGVFRAEALNAAITATTLVLLFFIILAHEFGHVFAARKQGIPTDRVMLTPIGGLAMLGGEAEGPGEVRIAAAGPMVNVAAGVLLIPILAAVGIPIGLSLLNPFAFIPLNLAWDWSSFVPITAYALFKANYVVLLFNLIPAFPLDGGRILRGLLHPRHGPIKSTLITTTVALVLAAGLVVWAVVKVDLFLMVIAILVGLTAYSVRKQIRSIQEQYELERSAFGFDYSASGASPVDDWQKADRVAARREEKERERRERERAEEREMDEEVDRLLDKISRDGIGSLTRREKAFLQKASRKKREVR